MSRREKCSYIIRNSLVDTVGEFSNPRQLQLEHLVLDLVVDHVDNLGGLLDQLGAGHLLDLDLLKLGLGVRLGLAGGAAPVAVADAAGIQTVQLSSLVLRKVSTNVPD